MRPRLKLLIVFHLQSTVAPLTTAATLSSPIVACLTISAFIVSSWAEQYPIQFTVSLRMPLRRPYMEFNNIHQDYTTVCRVNSILFLFVTRTKAHSGAADSNLTQKRGRDGDDRFSILLRTCVSGFCCARRQRVVVLQHALNHSQGLEEGEKLLLSTNRHLTLTLEVDTVMNLPSFFSTPNNGQS